MSQNLRPLSVREHCLTRGPLTRSHRFFAAAATLFVGHTIAQPLVAQPTVALPGERATKARSLAASDH